MAEMKLSRLRLNQNNHRQPATRFGSWPRSLGARPLRGVTSFAATCADAVELKPEFRRSTRKLYAGRLGQRDIRTSQAFVGLKRDDICEMRVFPRLVGLYAMISEMRVLSTTKTIESADEVARLIVNTYRAPNKTLPELEDMVNRGAVDVLQTFSEAARQEFRKLGV